MNKENLCYWYQASRDHRTHEIERNLGLEGTMGYEKMGCYKSTEEECSQVPNKCIYYTNLGDLLNDTSK